MTLFTDLLADPGAQRTYLVELSPYHISNTAVETLYFSDTAYTSGSGDTPASQFYAPRIKKGFAITRSLYRSGGKIGGRSTPDYGVIRLANLDGNFDTHDSTYAWDGRDITIKLGQKGWALSDFGTIFSGQMRGISITRDEMIVEIADNKLYLANTPYYGDDSDAEVKLYDGTNVAVKGTDLAFTAPDTISSSSTVLSVFSNSETIRIMGSTSNDGQYTISGTPTLTSINVGSGITTESAGDRVYIGRTTDTAGGDSVQGLSKPRVYGQVFNYKPPLINEAGLIYELNDTAIQSVDEVRDKGVPLTITTDYTEDLTNGRVTLTGTPDGEITVDMKGTKHGATYDSSPSQICRWIASSLGGVTCNHASFIAASSLFGSKTTGIVMQATDIVDDISDKFSSIMESIDALISPCGMYSFFNRDGEFVIGRFLAPAGTADFSFAENDILELKKLKPELPTWRQRVTFKKNWTQQSGASLALSIGEARREELAAPYQISTSSSGTVKDTHALAKDPDVVPALFWNESAASSEASRLQSLYGTYRDMYEVTVKLDPFQLELHDTVEITHSRFGLSSGSKFRVIELHEQAHKGTTKMILWG